MEKKIKDKFKILNIIFFAVISSVFVATLTVLYLKVFANLKDFVEAGSFVMYISPLVMISGVMIAYNIYKQAVQKAEKTEDRTEKLAIFYRTKLMQIILLGLSGEIVAVGILLKYQSHDVFMSAIIMLFLLFVMPLRKRFDKDFLKTDVDISELK